MIYNVPEYRIVDGSVCIVGNSCQDISVLILDLELVLTICQVTSSERLGTADCVLTLCVVEVHKCVSKLELIAEELLDKCQLSFRFCIYANFDQTLLVVMERCCDLEDCGIICHTVVGVCSVLVLHSAFRNDLADCVIVLSIFYIAMLVLIHAVKVILDQVECDRTFSRIGLGVYRFNNIFECFICALEIEREVISIQESSKQSLFCIQLQCAFCMVLVMEVISFALLDGDIELRYARFDFYIRRCNGYVQSDLCRVIRKVCLSVIDLFDRVGEAILKVFNPVDCDDDHIVLGIIYGACFCLVVHNVSECRILDGLSGVAIIDHVRALDSCDLMAASLIRDLLADDELKFFVLRQAVCEFLGAGDALLAPCLVVVRELSTGVCCHGHIQLRYIGLDLFFGHFYSYVDRIYGCTVIRNTRLSANIFFHCVSSCQIFFKVFLARIGLDHSGQVSIRIFFCRKSQINCIRIYYILEDRVLDHAVCIIHYCTDGFSSSISNCECELFCLNLTAIQEFDSFSCIFAFCSVGVNEVHILSICRSCFHIHVKN